MDLFDAQSLNSSGLQQDFGQAPLAVRMRPRNLSEISGQQHLLGPGAPLVRLIEEGSASNAGVGSVILWGPPGCGKTTLAYLIAGSGQRAFVELSAVTSGVKEVREVITQAKHLLLTKGRETVLFIDEVHRFTKTQQDALLPAVENRLVTLVAATTENPSFSVISPLLSRSLLLTLKPLTDDDLAQLLHRAVSSARGLDGSVAVTEQAYGDIVRLAGGDARKALTILEASAGAVLSSGGSELTGAEVARAVDVAAVRYDRAGDQHYDVISAFIKSMRGSDVDAALHYLARMIAAGEDPRFIARRIVIAASEDVGMADPSALQTAVAAAQAVALIGMPEARIILAQAVVHVACAPKSNASYVGVDRALADVRAGKIGLVPAHLRDAHYQGAKVLGHGKGYIYAHDAPAGVAAQEYLPEVLADVKYYEPTEHGFERTLKERWAKIRKLLGRK